MFLKRLAESNTWLEHLAEDVVRWRVWMPRMIDLEVSRACNLKCPGCLRNAPTSLRHREEKFCTLDRLRDIMEEIPTLISFNFMGDGEPTLNPEFQDMLGYISSKDIYTIITTNGTMLDERMVSEWMRSRVYRVHISVDGATKEIYESIRVGAEFGKIVENLKVVGSSGIPLCINMLISEGNIHEMPAMVRLCKEVGAREVTFLMPICTLGDDNGDGPMTRARVTGGNERLFDVTRDLCRTLGVRWMFPIGLSPLFRRLNFPFIRPQISLEGDVYSCCYMIGRGKTWLDGHLVDLPSEDYNFGNMFKKGFREIWHSDDMNELRTAIKRSERRRGTTISRGELRRMRENPPEGRFKYCEACLPRWGMACS